jgi:hypothetical protein
MDREQAKKLVKKVVSYFPNWRPDKDVIAFWVDRLEKEAYERVDSNLENYVSLGKEFAPPISVLIRKGSIASQLPLYTPSEEDIAANDRYLASLGRAAGEHVSLPQDMG